MGGIIVVSSTSCSQDNVLVSSCIGMRKAYTLLGSVEQRKYVYYKGESWVNHFGQVVSDLFC